MTPYWRGVLAYDKNCIESSKQCHRSPRMELKDSMAGVDSIAVETLFPVFIIIHKGFNGIKNRMPNKNPHEMPNGIPNGIPKVT